MQLSLPYVSILLVLNAVFLQTAWLWHARRGRNVYVDAITHFQKPNGALAKYYGWSVESVKNSVADGVIFESIMTVYLVLITLVTVSLTEFLLFIPLIVLIVLLSSANAIQMVYRVKHLQKLENNLLSTVSNAEDKIGAARRIVEDLYMRGSQVDGKAWFALFRIAQKQNKVGWSVRDVLLDEELRRTFTSIFQTGDIETESNQEGGPGIKSG